MAFDDLAKHMAARDGKKKLAPVPTDAADFVAQEAIADRRRNRERDLLLGTILMLGGLGTLVLFYFARVDAADEGGMGFPRIGMLGLAAGALALAGMRQIARALAGRSSNEAPTIDPFARR